MCQTDIKEKAFEDKDLLIKVVKFKEKFYHCAWADYEAARTGKVKLMLSERYIMAIEEDYVHMQNMLYGDKPAFSEVMKTIEKLQKEINLI